MYPNVSASLHLGGYDSSRILSEPLVSSSASFQLVDIGLNVSSGVSAFANLKSGHTRGLLHANGSEITSLEVEPGCGVPYMVSQVTEERRSAYDGC